MAEELCELGKYLKLNGFRKRDSFTWKLGDISVLVPRSEQPWWTVQKRNISKVRYFVDFPKDAPTQAIIAYIEKI